MTHRIIRRSHAAAALLPALALALSAIPAHAHGGIPRAFGIMFEPNKPSDVLLRSDVWGVFRSMDGGKSWLYGCAELYQSNSLNADHRNMAIAPGGRILVAASFSGLLMSDDLCSWKSSKTFSRSLADGGTFSELVQDVQPRGTDFFLLTATGENGVINGKLWKSPDKGDTWAVTGGPLPTDFAGTALGIPPSGAPKRIYASGRKLNAEGEIQRSDDDGMTWTASAVPTQMVDASIRLPLIHPTNPDIFFVWADQPEGLGVNSPDEMYGTKDGGKTFTLLYSSMGDLPGLALSPDNKELLIAGPLDGIWAANLDDALTMGQKAFQSRYTDCQPNPPCQVWGLNWTSDGLYAGMNDFAATNRATFGLSKDSGKTFTKVMDLCDVQFDSACGATTTMGQACPMVWQTGYAYDYTNGPRCMPDATGGATGAAGMSGAPTTGTGGVAGAVTTPSGGTTSQGGTTAVVGGAGGAGGAGVTGSAAKSGDTASHAGGGSSSGCSYSASATRPATGLMALALAALGLRARRRKR